VLGPVVAENELGGAATWGFILAAGAVGTLVGGLVALRFRPERLLLAATLSVFPFALPLALLSFPAPAVSIGLAAFVAGLGTPLFGAFWDTAMQEQIPAEQLSRVYSYDMLGSFVFIPLGAAIAGPISTVVGVTETLVGAAAIVIVATLLVLSIDEVRTLRRTGGVER